MQERPHGSSLAGKAEEGGGGAPAQDRWPSESGSCLDRVASRKPRGDQPRLHLGFYLGRPMPDFGPQTLKTLPVRCLKPVL